MFSMQRREMKLIQRCCVTCWNPQSCVDVHAHRSVPMNCDYCFDGCHFVKERDSVIYVGTCNQCKKPKYTVVR